MADFPTIEQGLQKEAEYVNKGDSTYASNLSKARIAATQALKQSQTTPGDTNLKTAADQAVAQYNTLYYGTPKVATAPSPVPSTTTLNVPTGATTPTAAPKPTTTQYGAPTTAPATPTTGGFTATGDQMTDAVLGMKSYADTPEGQAQQEKIKTLMDSLNNGSYSEAEKSQIQAAMDQAKAEYETEIAKAERAKAQGLPKALIAAGQQGGLMNTQFAGIAALFPTQGGDFMGTGGELNRIKSEYDFNIQDLRTKQLAAIQQAKMAAEDAIRTGKVQSLDIAMKMYEQAKAANEERNQLVQQKVSAIEDFQKKAQEVAKSTLSDYADAGYTSDSLDQTTLNLMDQKLGYKQGTSARLLDVAAAARSADSEQKQLEVATKFASYLKDAQPGGPPISFGGSTYAVLDHAYGTTGLESGDGGTYLWRYDNKTGDVTSTKLSEQDYKPMSTADGKIIGIAPGRPPVVLWDPTQVDGGVPNPDSLKKVYPPGSTFAQKECGIYADTITDVGNVGGDTYIGKMGRTDPRLKENTDLVTVGDVMVKKAGDTGHVQVILGITDLGDGRKQYYYTDANSDLKGTINYGYTTSDTVSGYIPANLKPEFSFGTDVRTTTDPRVDSYASLVQSGQTTLASVPNYLQDAVAKKLSSTESVTKATEDISDTARAIMNGTLTLDDVGTTGGRREAVAKELDKIKEEARKSGDFTGYLQATAGGKPISDTAIQALAKNAQVVNQIQDLASSMKSVKTNDPIMGILRSNNPYDVQAQELKARLQAIIPSLARGVYGEVGVLTDQDIENYKKTLPNITQPEQLRNLVLSMTIKSLAQNFRTQLQTLGNSGRDVSGFTDQYALLQKQADDLLASVPQTTATTVTPEKRGILDSLYDLFTK